MSQDLAQYAQIIEQLKPMVKEPEFNQVLRQLAGDLPREKQFLIKMEVKRLARPCMRSIDLRGQVDGECRLYEYGGIKHYLDDVAIEVFEQQARLFGHYSFGVYERVLRTENNFRVQREKAEQQTAEQEELAQSNPLQILEQYTVPAVNLLEYAQRKNERMNFACALEIFTENNSSIRAMSVDISIDGMKVKLTKEHLFKPGEKLVVYFRGMEAEFALDKRTGVSYKIVKITRKQDNLFLALVKTNDINNPSFEQFLEKFIHGNKRRYKVNMTNTVDAIINKSYEQYFSPQCPALPVYVDVIEQHLIPRYCMVNDINRTVMEYWCDEQGEIRLGYLLSARRLARLANNKNDEQATYAYSFNHVQNGRVYFYSATIEELEAQPALKNIFFAFGARKVSWRVFKIKLSPMSPDQAHTPLSIPDAVGTKIKRQNTPPAPRLMARLKNLRYIAQVVDITSDNGQHHYAKLPLRRGELQKLKIFAHPRNKLPAEIKPFRYKYNEQRLETRYLLRSAIELSGSGEQLIGVSEDISVNGLRIELNKEFAGAADSRVVIGFPSLQKITKKHDVMSLQYRVVGISEDRNVIHLKAIAGDEGRSARAFFDELIKQNKSQLKTYPDEEEIPGIGHALRCINAKNPPTTAFVLGKEGIRFLPQGAIVNHNDPRVRALAEHFGNRNNINVEFMFRDRNMDSPFIQQGVKQVKVESAPLYQEIYIAFDPTQKENRMAIIPRIDARFNGDEERSNFIKEALSRGQFIALHAMIATTGKPDLEMLQSEINYVGVYAIHRAKELEEKLWRIKAAVYLVDITEEILRRYGFDRATIEANAKRPKKPSVETNGIKAILNSVS